MIPFSLGGKAVIEAASCGDCEKVTSYLDGHATQPSDSRPLSRTAGLR
jgi:hypothetical protein